MNNSSAWFFALWKVNERQLSLFKYIEDGDLWKWQLKDSKLFYAGLFIHELPQPSKERSCILLKWRLSYSIAWETWDEDAFLSGITVIIGFKSQIKDTVLSVPENILWCLCRVCCSGLGSGCQSEWRHFWPAARAWPPGSNWQGASILHLSYVEPRCFASIQSSRSY